MELSTILINFDSKREQKKVEKLLPFSVWEHDTDDLWTEFGLSDCDPDILLNYLVK